MELNKRFWAKVNKTKGCWEWLAYKGKHGYGVCSLGGTTYLVHRLAYAEANSMDIEDLKGLQVHHTCHNKVCVNLDHLQVMTQQEHNKEPDSSFSLNSAKTHCPHGHEYTPENIYRQTRKNKNGVAGRQCRECTLARTKTARAKTRYFKTRKEIDYGVVQAASPHNL